MGTTTDTQLITAFAAHQRVRGFSARTVARRTWSLGHLAAAGPLAEHDAASLELFLSRWPSAQSRYSVRSDCHQFYRWAIRRGHLAADPTEQVDPPRLRQRQATPLSDDELRAAILRANGDQRRAVMLGAYAGLRMSEIAALDMRDVHRDRRLLVVRDGKGGRDAVVPLADELAAVLPDIGAAVGYPHGQAVGAAVRRLFRLCGIRARPHDLRHTFGTAVARRSGGNMVLVAKLLRHASVTTSQRYVAWDPAGAEVIDALYGDAA